MPHIWDYNAKKIKKSKQGKIFFLERKINYGRTKNEKIKLSEVKKYWNKLHLLPLRKRFFELLLWGK